MDRNLQWTDPDRNIWFFYLIPEHVRFSPSLCECGIESGEGKCVKHFKEGGGQKIRITLELYRSNNEPYPHLYETKVSIKRGLFGSYRTIMDYSALKDTTSDLL